MIEDIIIYYSYNAGCVIVYYWLVIMEGSIAIEVPPFQETPI